MKAISGYAEWFWLMCRNLKDVENRDWPLFRYFRSRDLPVKVYLHGSKSAASREEIDFILATLPCEQAEQFLEVDFRRYRGQIMGEVVITGQTVVRRHQAGMFPGRTSPWLFGPYGFWVKDGVLYQEPVPFTGQLGFFDVPNAGHLERGRES